MTSPTTGQFRSGKPGRVSCKALFRRLFLEPLGEPRAVFKNPFEGAGDIAALAPGLAGSLIEEVLSPRYNIKAKDAMNVLLRIVAERLSAAPPESHALLAADQIAVWAVGFSIIQFRGSLWEIRAESFVPKHRLVMQ